MKRALIAGLAIALTAGAALAYDAASQVKDRQANMKQIGGAMKGLYDTLSGDKDPAKLKTYAANINALAGKVPSWFPVGSGPSSGEKTKAKAEVWTDPVGFKAASADFAAQAAKLNAAAQTGDAEKVQAAFGAVRGTCKGCHDKYQAK
ncbi:cytochrome c [Caulobacter sp. NIBR1757]|uniref:c-type cytochrome n=1 Tax=Caulobacter sp. NIBR1757 TaxID=3016000 RepID=UPI0022EFF61B|nr:cytochrome c [Caulobacter sp. NIBR1757]WGM40328.1 Cytochrome c' [Caulobacter sp. NIBR1757]